MSDCQHCATDSGVHDFNKACCRARFIVSLPRKNMRTACIDRWSEKLPKAFINEIKEEIKRLWEVRSGR